MKRCRAVTTRAMGAVECTLAAEHEGAHAGEHVEDGVKRSAIWNDPNAPYFEDLEPPPSPLPVIPPAPPMPALEELAPEYFPEPRTRPDGAAARKKTIATHCACGTEHTPDDRELRVGPSGVPLLAMSFGELEPDHRFSWARVCIGCGAVYCRIWNGDPVAAEPRGCTCPMVSRMRLDFTHASNCPAFQSP